MPKRNHKPFENHIESNEFNINPLIDAGTNIPHHVLHPRLEEWLETMPQSMTKGQWDDQLDNMQKRLRHSLAIEMVQRGMLDEFAEQLEDIDDETLTLMMHYPITIALLSQDYFRQNGYPHDWESPDTTAVETNSRQMNDLSVFAIWRRWAKLGFQRVVSWVRDKLDNLPIPK